MLVLFSISNVFKKSVVQVLGEHCPTLHSSCSLYLCLVKYIYYVALIANCHNIYTEIFPFFSRTFTFGILILYRYIYVLYYIYHTEQLIRFGNQDLKELRHLIEDMRI